MAEGEGGGGAWASPGATGTHTYTAISFSSLQRDMPGHVLALNITSAHCLLPPTIVGPTQPSLFCSRSRICIATGSNVFLRLMGTAANYVQLNGLVFDSVLANLYTREEKRV